MKTFRKFFSQVFYLIQLLICAVVHSAISPEFDEKTKSIFVLSPEGKLRGNENAQAANAGSRKEKGNLVGIFFSQILEFCAKIFPGQRRVLVKSSLVSVRFYPNEYVNF